MTRRRRRVTHNVEGTQFGETTQQAPQLKKKGFENTRLAVVPSQLPRWASRNSHMESSSSTHSIELSGLAHWNFMFVMAF